MGSTRRESVSTAAETGSFVTATAGSESRHSLALTDADGDEYRDTRSVRESDVEELDGGDGASVHTLPAGKPVGAEQEEESDLERVRKPQSAMPARSLSTASTAAGSSSVGKSPISPTDDGELPAVPVVDTFDPLSLQGGSKDFGFLPIPRKMRWDPAQRPAFTLTLNILFGLCSTFTVANLYYPQPILIVLSNYFGITYEEVADIPTLLQTGYALGLLLIVPMSDMVRRRQLLLGLVFLSTILSLALAFIRNVIAFQVVCFFIALFSVTPQVLLPLAGDLAPADKRASALSIVLSGLLFGILFARVFAGLIAQFGSVRDIYLMSFGLQIAIFAMLYWLCPDYPRKTRNVSYLGILGSMAKYAVTEPVLVQASLMGISTSAIFSSFFTTMTFLLGETYKFNALQISLFALIGVAGCCTAPFCGKLIDRLVPFTGILIGISIVTLSQTLYTAAAGISLAVPGVCIVLLDIGQQMTQVSQSKRVFDAAPTAARARWSAVYIVALFIGQLIGTAAGTRVFLKHGYRAAGGMCLGLLAYQLVILCVRGPHLPTNRWFGYEGGWELRKGVAEAKRRAKADEENARTPAKEKVAQSSDEETKVSPQ